MEKFQRWIVVILAVTTATLTALEAISSIIKTLEKIKELPPSDSN